MERVPYAAVPSNAELAVFIQEVALRARERKVGGWVEPQSPEIFRDILDRNPDIRRVYLKIFKKERKHG